MRPAQLTTSGASIETHGLLKTGVHVQMGIDGRFPAAALGDPASHPPLPPSFLHSSVLCRASTVTATGEPEWGGEGLEKADENGAEAG